MSPTSYRTAPPRVNKHFKSESSKSNLKLVGLGRVELPTSRLSGVRSNQLSYRPMSLLRVKLSALTCEFCRKKEPHFSSVRSVSTVDAPEGRVASVAIKLPAIYFSADFERSMFPERNTREPSLGFNLLRSQISEMRSRWN